MSRPAHHLTAERGFLNDPTGLVLLDGAWHAWYQVSPAPLTATCRGATPSATTC